MSYETFTWWPKELSCRLNKWLLLGDYAIWTVIVSEKSEMNTRIHSKTQDRFFWSNSCFTVTSLSSKIFFSSVHTCTEKTVLSNFAWTANPQKQWKKQNENNTRTKQRQRVYMNTLRYVHIGNNNKKVNFCSLKF